MFNMNKNNTEVQCYGETNPMQMFFTDLQLRISKSVLENYLLNFGDKMENLISLDHF